MEKTFLTVTLPIAIGAIVMALMGIVRRRVMKSKSLSTLQYLISIYSLATVIYGIIYLSAWGFTMPEVLPGFWIAVLCGSFANVLIQFFNAKAASIDKGEVSLTAPLQAMTPGLVTLMALAIGEFPSKMGMLGILFMAVGSYILLFEKTPGRLYQYFGPLGRVFVLFKLNTLSEDEKRKAKVVALAFGSAFMGTFGLLFGGLYVRKGQSIQGLVLASMILVFLLSMSYSVMYAVKRDSKPDQRFANSLQSPILILILSVSALWVLHVFLIDSTYKKTFVAYVGTLKRFSVIFSVLFGYLFFKEGDFKKRMWAAILILIGAGLISTDELPAKLSVHLESFGF